MSTDIDMDKIVRVCASLQFDFGVLPDGVELKETSPGVFAVTAIFDKPQHDSVFGFRDRVFLGVVQRPWFTHVQEEVVMIVT